MLSKSKIVYLSSLLLLILSCSSTKNTPTKTIFPFEYYQDSFEIISVNAASGEGINYLVQLEGDSTISKSIDYDQDGIVDFVQYGAFTIELADSIYDFGIRQAIAQDKFKNRNSAHVFQHSDEDFQYSIRTFGFYRDELNNEFIIHNPRLDSDEVFIDLDADGNFDEVSTSTRSLQEVQPYYEWMLKLGVEQEKIEYSAQKYIVQKLFQKKFAFE